MSSLDIRAEESAEALVTKIKAAQNVQAARAYNTDYAFSRIWRLVLKLSNCAPEQKDLLVEYKCEIRSLLLLLQEMKVDLAEAEMASQRLKTHYQKEVK